MMTKMCSKNQDHTPLENHDFLIANAEKFKECSLCDLIDVALKSGRMIFFGISYSAVPSKIDSSEFVVKNHHNFQLFLRLLHMSFFLFLFIPFVTENIVLSNCCLINFIKKGILFVNLFFLIAGYYCLEIRGRRAESGVAGIYRQCILLQSKFTEVGLHFPAKTKVRALGWFISFGACMICLIRQVIFATKHHDHWYSRPARLFGKTVSFGLWVPSNHTTSATLQIVLGSFGMVIDWLSSNYWFYVNIIHFSCAVTMWMVFKQLNNAMKAGYFKVNDLAKIVDLHFHSVKLLKLINQFISPITFWLIIFDVTCLCFWSNYIALDLNIRPIYIVGICFFIKTWVELILVADVNSKAHEITEWLEESCADSEKLPPMDLMKFTVFTSQIYNKESTGFRGLNFFVVTSHLTIAIAGIAITYTVAVNQLCKSN